MNRPVLPLPTDVVVLAQRRYTRDVAMWLRAPAGCALSLGSPREADARADPAAFAQWLNAWSTWSGPGRVVRESARWRGLGTQDLPSQLVLDAPADVAAVAQMDTDWAALCSVDTLLCGTWPALRAELPPLPAWRAVAVLPAVERRQLIALVSWLLAHPDSGLSPREVPVEGIDTKWIESRTDVIARMLRLLRPGPHPSDFRALCGFRADPVRLRIRVLCPALRAQLGGLRDIEAPLTELAAMPLRPDAVLVVENLATGLALADRHGVVAVPRLGYAISQLGQLPWVAHASVVYWGDLDTHGLTMLGRTRTHLPQLTSVLMDEATLLAHPTQWGVEGSQALGESYGALTAAELDLLVGLQQGRWGDRVRLEQERVHWPTAEAALDAVLPPRVSTPAEQRGAAPHPTIHTR